MTPPIPPAGRILIAEDEPAVAEMIAEVLRARGYEVETAADGAIALQLLAGAGFDLVLSDVAMPGFDGVALYRAVTERYPALRGRFAFMSAVIPRPELMDLVERRAVPLLRKPFVVGELVRLVERLLAVRR
jgi:CheY-like chemotaxis protein